MFEQLKNQLMGLQYIFQTAQNAIRDWCCSDILYTDFCWPQFANVSDKRQESAESDWYILRELVVVENCYQE